jgi:hypothetical protein
MHAEGTKTQREEIEARDTWPIVLKEKSPETQVRQVLIRSFVSLEFKLSMGQTSVSATPSAFMLYQTLL